MTPVSEIDKTTVVPLITNVMLTIMTAVNVGVLTMIAETITGRDVGNLPQSQSITKVVHQNIRSEIEEFHVVYL